MSVRRPFGAFLPEITHKGKPTRADIPRGLGAANRVPITHLYSGEFQALTSPRSTSAEQ